MSSSCKDMVAVGAVPPANEEECYNESLGVKVIINRFSMVSY